VARVDHGLNGLTPRTRRQGVHHARRQETDLDMRPCRDRERPAGQAAGQARLFLSAPLIQGPAKTFGRFRRGPAPRRWLAQLSQSVT